MNQDKAYTELVKLMTTHFDEIKAEIAEVKSDVRELKTDMVQVKDDVNTIASVYGFSRDRATGKLKRS